jgi:uncharacterized protein (TIGR00255 family)
MSDVTTSIGSAENPATLAPVVAMRRTQEGRLTRAVRTLVLVAGALLGTALDALGAMRHSEGERIAELIRGRLGETSRIAASVRVRMPAVLEAVRVRQRDRLAKLDVEGDADRLEMELALVAQKLDVDEELDRLESHVREIRDSLAASEPVGRRLDFLLQELNREANTLGSKSADTDTTRAAVDLKELIEQMLDQVQNVE